MKYTVIDLFIANGDSTSVESQELEEGKVIKVALFSETTPSEPIDIQIKGSEGEIHPFVSHREFMPTNGNHLESRKDLEITGGRKITITARASGNLAADFKGQLLFYIEEK
jgi:hypothetical protein